MTRKANRYTCFMCGAEHSVENMVPACAVCVAAIERNSRAFALEECANVLNGDDRYESLIGLGRKELADVWFAAARRLRGQQ